MKGDKPWNHDGIGSSRRGEKGRQGKQALKSWWNKILFLKELRTPSAEAVWGKTCMSCQESKEKGVTWLKHIKTKAPAGQRWPNDLRPPVSPKFQATLPHHLQHSLLVKAKLSLIRWTRICLRSFASETWLGLKQKDLWWGGNGFITIWVCSCYMYPFFVVACDLWSWMLICLQLVICLQLAISSSLALLVMVRRQCVGTWNSPPLSAAAVAKI